ncbi:MAG TPA: nicotinamide-nucleotide amidase [Burkholderiales bacterium]|jgi:nicotinamide-nucleotide amidase|nr:nicotinamide-nucleotide amidase [Burkholderiales bacterium]
MADTLSLLGTLVGARLKERGLVLACAESCTGGWVAQTVTAVAGSSAWFDRGFVTYSNQAKEDMLGVPAQTLEQFGAVSEETARAMAAGALTHSLAQVALSITGIAGPTGGTPEKPVGLVCFGWAKGEAARTESVRFDGDREAVRRQAVIHALQGLLALIEA